MRAHRSTHMSDDGDGEVHDEDEDGEEDDDDDDDEDEDEDADDSKTGKHSAPAQSKRTWTCHKSHFVWKFNGKMPDTPENTSIKHRAFILTLFGEKRYGKEYRTLVLLRFRSIILALTVCIYIYIHNTCVYICI